MIRYPAAIRSIEEEIRAISPNWLRNARRRAARFRSIRAYRERTSSWSVVKPVYMEIQHHKCAYCERTLESEEQGKIEWDVEHYRPKRNVEAWPNPGLPKRLSYQFPTGRQSAKGYYLLAYNLSNYIASCKVCNTSHKLNYFPIGSSRRSLSTTNPSALRRERPFIPYPIGTIDEDPEGILTFRGYICVPVADSGHRRRRALVTIDLLGLNDRDNLMQKRAEIIVSTWEMLESLRATPNAPVPTLWIQMVTSARSNHTNCARCFVREYNQDRATARRYMQSAFAYIKSKDN